MNETDLVKRYRNGDLLSDIEKLQIFALQDSGRFDEIEALDQIQGTLLSQIHNRIECSGIIVRGSNLNDIFLSQESLEDMHNWGGYHIA